MSAFKQALVLVLCVVLGCSFQMQANAQTDAKSLFTLENIQGEVLHVADGQQPKLMKSGEKVSGGRLVTLEEGTAKITFPDGKNYPVPPNTLLFLDPKYNTLEGAVAAAASIRDPSVQFVLPAENATLPLNKPFALIVGIALDGANVKGVHSFTIQAASVEEPNRLIELGQIEVKTVQTGHFCYSKLAISKTPAKPGDYELIVKTVEKPVGKKIGKGRSVTFGE